MAARKTVVDKLSDKWGKLARVANHALGSTSVYSEKKARAVTSGAISKIDKLLNDIEAIMSA